MGTKKNWPLYMNHMSFGVYKANTESDQSWACGIVPIFFIQFDLCDFFSPFSWPKGQVPSNAYVIRKVYLLSKHNVKFSNFLSLSVHSLFCFGLCQAFRHELLMLEKCKYLVSYNHKNAGYKAHQNTLCLVLIKTITFRRHKEREMTETHSLTY